MAKKIVRLNEQDIENLVKKIIKEEEFGEVNGVRLMMYKGDYWDSGEYGFYLGPIDDNGGLSSNDNVYSDMEELCDRLGLIHTLSIDDMVRGKKQDVMIGSSTNYHEIFADDITSAEEIYRSFKSEFNIN
tara:strand:+ start:75 stop:464 length:390 start_codon:yes stop_codon:yes gene_type:complete